MHERPIHPLVETLTALGAKIDYLEKDGVLLAHQWEKAQRRRGISFGQHQFTVYLSLADGCTSHGKGTDHAHRKTVKALHRPHHGYDGTMWVIVKWAGNDILVKPQEYQAIELTVETDWSAASYWYEMVALMPGAEVMLLGLQKVSGRCQCSEPSATLGCHHGICGGGSHHSSHKTKSKKILHDFVNEPDLAQTFVVTCCFKGIPVPIFGHTKSLKIKETDRGRL